MGIGPRLTQGTARALHIGAPFCYRRHMKAANENDRCKSCASTRLEWVRDNGWVTGSWSYLRCKSCGDCIRTRIPVWFWLMMAIALAAAVCGWVVVSR